MVAGSCRASLGDALWHGLCDVGIVSARSVHAQSVRLSLPHGKRGMRQTHSLPRPRRRGTPEPSLWYDKRCQPKLSRSDFVQWGKVGKVTLLNARTASRRAYIPVV